MFSMRIRQAVSAGVVMGALALAGSAHASDADKLISRIQELRAQYTVTLGMYDQLRADVEAISVLPNAKEISGLTGSQFSSALTACWDAPIQKAEGFQRSAIDLKRAAETFKDRAAMRELKETQSEVQNARGSVQSCRDAALASAKVDTSGMNDAATSALEGKISLLDQVRILTKHELPGRAKGLTEHTAKLQGEVVAALKTAEVKAEAAGKNPFGGGGKKEKAEVQRLKGVETEAKELQDLVTRELSQMPSELSSTSQKIVTNITNVSALLGN